ncbi:unnamed protein product [Urochloa humidicola]
MTTVASVPGGATMAGQPTVMTIPKVLYALNHHIKANPKLPKPKVILRTWKSSAIIFVTTYLWVLHAMEEAVHHSILNM